MFGVLPDGVSEVEALREEIEGLQWTFARAYNGDKCYSFYGEDAHTGESDVQFLALALPVGSLVDVMGSRAFTARFVRVRGEVGGKNCWMNVNSIGYLYSDEDVCLFARRGKRVVVRRPGLVDALNQGEGDGEPSFTCVNGYTGEETSYRVSNLPVGTVVFVEHKDEGDIMWARVNERGNGVEWLITDRFGEVFEAGAPSADDLMPGASGRLPVVYPGLG